jgi:hypothetical protein
VNLYLCIFPLALEPIVYDKAGENWSSNTSRFIFNVTSESDFDQLESNCIVDENQGSLCLNLSIRLNNCSSTFIHNGTLGCNYKCYFITKKTGYTDKSSNSSKMDLCEYLYKLIDEYLMMVDLVPPQPKIDRPVIRSRSISIGWSIPEPDRVYMKYFTLYRNDIPFVNVSTSMVAYDYTQLFPNRK